MPDAGHADEPPFTLAEVRKMIVGAPSETIRECRCRFDKNLDQILKSWHRPYGCLTPSAVKWVPDARRMAIAIFLHDHSLLSVVSIGFAQRLSTKNPPAVIGPDVDPVKVKIYRDECRRLGSACDLLGILVKALDRVLSKTGHSWTSWCLRSREQAAACPSRCAMHSRQLSP